jgi:hypothetical protein
MLRVDRLVALTATLALLTPSLASAQAPAQPTDRAGVVTRLEGTVTADRVAVAQPIALKYKDDVHVRDKIVTREQSLARMLLHGKAVVTVRERSSLTITEQNNRVSIDLQSGKFALAVAKERMQPGEVIEIRTPNAVAAVRGSVIVTEVEETPPQAPPVSNMYVLTGALDAQPADPGTRAPLGTSQPISPLQQFRVVGITGTVLPIRQDQFAVIRSGLQPRTRPHTDSAVNQAQLTEQSIQTATSLAAALAGSQVTVAQDVIAPSAPILQVSEQPITVIAPLIPLTPELQTKLATGGASGNLVGGLLANPGFESGTFAGWTLSGAGAVLTRFGPLTPPEGQFFSLIHSATASVLSGCGPGSDCTRTTVSQPFQVSSIVTVSARGFLVSNEFPSFTSSNSSFNDRYLIQLIDSAGSHFTLFDQRVNETAFSPIGESVLAGTFFLGATGGFAPFDLGKKTVVLASGPATFQASVSNVSDTVVDSGILLDAVQILQDPPRFFITNGHLNAGTLLALADGTDAADSLMMVCCGGSATLNGPAIRATNSEISLPFGVLSAIQGGSIVSTWGGPLVDLDGGRYALGPLVSMFTVAGTQPDDQPLQHSGAFVNAANASIATGNVMIVDTALLQASAPLLHLTNSSLVAHDSAVDLQGKARLTGLGPLFALDRSQLVVAAGALVNVRNGSSLTVNGDLVRLANGSSLSLLNGPLAQVLGNSSLTVTGSLVAFAGAGNSLSITNSLCSTFACANVGGLNVALTGGASAGNVSITNAISGSGTVSMSPGSAALLVSGPGSTVKVGP